MRQFFPYDDTHSESRMQHFYMFKETITLIINGGSNWDNVCPDERRFLAYFYSVVGFMSRLCIEKAQWKTTMSPNGYYGIDEIVNDAHYMR
jgi:hypothetical protein